MNLLCAPVEYGFYDIKFETLDGIQVKTSAYHGKKVIVAVVSADSSNLTLVRYLDSVQKVNSGVQVIAIPTGDFNGNIDVQDLKNIRKKLSILVTKPLRVKKSSASLQHPLFNWLTQAKENKHFDMDVEGEGQVFVISTKGTLYSVLPKNTPKAVIGKIINKSFNE